MAIIHEDKENRRMELRHVRMPDGSFRDYSVEYKRATASLRRKAFRMALEQAVEDKRIVAAVMASLAEVMDNRATA